MSILFAILGKNPILALWVYFIDPLIDSYSLQELAVKATPLVMIAIGLSLCYLANVWNIGAEGQFLIGAVAGSWLAVETHGTDAGLWVLPVMLLLGAAGGALYALIPAICRVRFGASEILTSLMLVYVADLFLDYLVRGPWRDPAGYNFPTTAEFDPVATVPLLVEGGRLHLGAVIALVVVIAAAILLGRTIKGFEIRVVGAAPRAARFGGFSSNQLILFTFAISGALAGLAGIIEVAGPVGHLQPGFSPGYGFTAIIVAFLGRLNPGWNINCRAFSRAHLHRRRTGPDCDENTPGCHQGLSRHSAVLRAGVRLPHSLPVPADFPFAAGAQWKYLKPSSCLCSPPRRRC